MLIASHWSRLALADSNVWTPPPSTLTQVQPYMAQSVVDSYGVAALPSFQTSVYAPANQPTYVGYLGTLAPGFVRVVYASGNAGVQAFMQRCRDQGLKVLALVVPESNTSPTNETEPSVRATVQHLAANWPDIVAAVEGLNEPNHDRGTGSASAGWAQKAYDVQRWVWNAVGDFGLRALGVKVVMCSLHDTLAGKSYTEASPSGGAAHWHQLATLGIASYFDWVGVHRYSAGQVPLNGFDSRTVEIRDAFGANIPIWITETGFNNALDTTRHPPTSEKVSGIYGPRALLEFACQQSTSPISNFKMTRFELMDDAEPGLVNHESHFGLVAVGNSDTNVSGWRLKPEFSKMKALLDHLRDPGPEFTPPTVGCEVTGGPGDMQWIVTAKRDGSAKIHLWRSAKIWDPKTRTEVSSGFTVTNATVTDEQGARSVPVGADVVTRDLRLSA